jgi:hypothetical protein
MEYEDAFRPMKRGKNLYMLLVALAVLVQLGAFVLAEFTEIIGPIGAAPKDQTAATLRNVLAWAMPIAKFVAPVACGMAILLLLFSVKLSLIGRLGGVGGLVGALLWAVLLLMLVTPWQQILRGSMATGALCNLPDLLRGVSGMKTPADGKAPEMLAQAIYYGRFIAYPVVALFVWVLVQCKYARGYKAMTFPPAVQIPTQPSPQL